jgi:hypothetical protein
MAPTAASNTVEDAFLTLYALVVANQYKSYRMILVPVASALDFVR